MHWDCERLNDLYQRLGDDRFRQLKQTTLNQLPELVEELRNAREAGDHQSCQRLVHTLKSSVATYGADDFAARLQRLESQLAAGQQTLLGTVMEQIEEEIDVFASTLTHFPAQAR